MRRISIVSAVAAALMLMAPLTASAAPPAAAPPAAAPPAAAPPAAAPPAAAPPAAAPKALAHCPNGLMWADYNTNVYSGWNSTRVIGHIQANDLVGCIEGYDLGRRYTACGVTNGNGWVRILFTDGSLGWSPQGCFTDY
ncbi:hypothetical protein [Saccharothrix xinjiangensis]|uniref:hypothetical protein n=1 Tax=Saccharothrix xinjiangensis TaxID=204798 RepID=UPI0031CFC87E